MYSVSFLSPFLQCCIQGQTQAGPPQLRQLSVCTNFTRGRSPRRRRSSSSSHQRAIGLARNRNVQFLDGHVARLVCAGHIFHQRKLVDSSEVQIQNCRSGNDRYFPPHPHLCRNFIVLADPTIASDSQSSIFSSLYVPSQTDTKR